MLAGSIGRTPMLLMLVKEAEALLYSGEKPERYNPLLTLIPPPGTVITSDQTFAFTRRPPGTPRLYPRYQVALNFALNARI
ncbi:unnamed protein product [Lasius platythorax]|uniref:Uncharacterized protein n=1 Tax=Lasius platythorax TaxID=488582 RepID=A0AAV2NPY8_9HYME